MAMHEISQLFFSLSRRPSFFSIQQAELLSQNADALNNTNDLMVPNTHQQQSFNSNDFQQSLNGLNALQQKFPRTNQQGANNSTAALLSGLTNQQSLPMQLLSGQQHNMLGNSSPRPRTGTRNAEQSTAHSSLAARSSQHMIGDAAKQNDGSSQHLQNNLLPHLLTNTHSDCVESTLLQRLNAQQQQQQQQLQQGDRETRILQLLLDQQRKQNEKKNQSIHKG